MSILIIGGGIAGLTLAERLAQQGKKVVIVEIENNVGGLARSFTYDDGFCFDMGPHRFHTDIHDVQEYLNEILENDQKKISRLSSVHFYDKYFDWPLMLKDTFRLSPFFIFGCALDLIRRYSAPLNDSFTAYVIQRYGQTIYKHFFENYTMKFLRLSPDYIHKTWASASINRAIIDDKIIKQSTSLFKLAMSVMIPNRVETTFCYPATGPIDVFVKKQAAIIKQKGGEIITGEEAASCKFENKRIISITLKSGKVIQCDKVIYTAPITDLLSLLNKPIPELQFLSTVFYNLALYGKPKLPYQWCYFGDQNLIFSRISCMNFFNEKLVPDADSTALSVELPTYVGDMLWEHPEKFINLIVRDLIKVGYMHNFNEVKFFHIEKVKNTYPVYTLKYQEHLNKAYSQISDIDNLYLLGRCGTFWYNNMDHSIKMALDLSKDLLAEKHVPIGKYQVDFSR